MNLLPLLLLRKKLFLVSALSVVLFFLTFQPSFSQDIAIGTYIGNGGVAQDVTGIGFTPVGVIIQKEGVATNFIATNSMSGKAKLNAAGAMVSNYITGFGVGKFTVGTNSANANTSGVTYYFTAFGSSVATTGTFTGTGADQAIAVGFEPKAAWSIQESGTWPSVSHMNMRGFEANSFKMEGGASDWHKENLGAYSATGFVARSYCTVGEVYHYVAFGQGDLGTYTGNAVPRTITTVVASDPFFAIMKDQGASPGATHWYRQDNMPANTSYRFNGLSSTCQVTDLSDDGFDIGACTDANISGSTSQWFTFGSAAVLPVELTYFRGKRTGNSIELEWETASEINSDYFVVEKSEDGEEFYPIGYVGAAGNSLETLHYDFEDQDPYEENNYYRLRQFDFNGSYLHSKTAAVNFTTESSISRVELYPNPSTGEQLNVLVHEIKSKGYSKLEIFNAVGQLTYTEEVYVKGKGDNLIINTSALEVGVYLLKITDASGFEYQSKFVKKG
jgi:hypothetical protein